MFLNKIYNIQSSTKEDTTLENAHLGSAGTKIGGANKIVRFRVW